MSSLGPLWDEQLDHVNSLRFRYQDEMMRFQSGVMRDPKRLRELQSQFILAVKMLHKMEDSL